MKKILILTDQRGYLASSSLPGRFMADVGKIRAELRKRGFEVEVKSLHAVRFPSKYRGWYVVYPSSEEPGLFYKSYIEDVLLRLKMDGAVLMPGFEFFRAHHNKVFMELYRTLLGDEYNSLKSVVFYGVADFKRKIKLFHRYPIVIKTSEGSSSEGVSIAKNKHTAIHAVKNYSRISFFSSMNTPVAKGKAVVKKMLHKVKKVSKLEKVGSCEKMVAQIFIPDLKCDYKVLVFDKNYYVLRRKVRNKDFRASGSGKFEFPSKAGYDITAVLNYAKKLYGQLDVPLLSADIAYDGRQCHLIEFQCVNFGPYTLEFSDHYYRHKDGAWQEVPGKSSLEKEMAKSYEAYMLSH